MGGWGQKMAIFDDLQYKFKSKYYSNIGNTFTLIGKVKNIGNISE